MDMATRSKVSETQKRNWEKRRAGLEQLSALKATHKRVLEVMLMMVPLVERQAHQGDPLARYLVDELDVAETARKAEHVAASDLIAEHESSTS